MQKEKQNKIKIIAIVGPTASGKTDLSIKIALDFNGEIISADSRQVYIGLDIGTEKITKEEMCGIPHHLIDIKQPEEIFSAQEFKTRSEKIIEEIENRGKVPIVVGGTGFYIDSLINNTHLPEVKPNKKLREMLEKKDISELFNLLKEKDSVRASQIDKYNKRRLVRALEIIEEIGLVPKLKKTDTKYDVLHIGIKTNDDKLKEKINKRLNTSLLSGLIKEAIKLIVNGITLPRLNEFGLEYRIAGQFIRNEITHDEMVDKMKKELWQYAKRQKTWFKRNKNIKWYSVNEIEKIEKEIENFLALD